MTDYQGWIGVDFDGVLARYDRLPVWDGSLGDPVPEMLARVRGWLAEGRDVRIVTARVAAYGDPAEEAVGTRHPDAQRVKIEAWCLRHLGRVLPVTATKDHGMIELWDDRAVRVRVNEGAPCCDHHAPGDRDKAEAHVRGLLRALGQDTTSEELRDTPRRVARMLREMLLPEPFAFTTFPKEAAGDEMIIQTRIPFVSLCAHHMVPFTGHAAVAYVPGERIVGLSKLARAVRYCAAGLQTQERITTAVADMLQANLEPQGVAVLLRAEHLCMTIRGVKAPGTLTTTSCLRGAFKEDGRCRAEFLTLANGQ